MFLFDPLDGFDADPEGMKNELSMRMRQAAESLNTVRRINSRILRTDLPEVIAEDIDYRIMMDGKFHKKDNRQESEDMYSFFLKALDKVRGFELKVGPSGDFAAAAAEIRRAGGENIHAKYANLVRCIDGECLNLLKTAGEGYGGNVVPAQGHTRR